jgi:hypothetical protein
MTLHAELLGHGADGQRASMFLEGLLMAQVAMIVARLGIPDLMAAGPRRVADLATETGADPDALGRVLAAAAAYGLVRRDGTGSGGTGPGDTGPADTVRYALTSTGSCSAPTWTARPAASPPGSSARPCGWSAATSRTWSRPGRSTPPGRAGCMSTTAGIPGKPGGSAGQ